MEIRRIANEPGDRRALVDKIYGIATEACRAPAQAEPGVRESTLKMVAGLFAESVHETYTREQIVSVVEDMIRLGRPSSSLSSTEQK